MPPLRLEEDAYGQAMVDHLRGRDAWEIVERDDGSFSMGAGPELYFAEFEQWRLSEQRAMRYVHGRVLDLGCGAGRAILYLQPQGHEVVGIDNSSGAIEVSGTRGPLDVRPIDLGDLPADIGTFDTVLMLGGGLGLLGDPEHGHQVLRKLADVTSQSARLIGASRDWTEEDDPDIQEYIERNLRMGRLSGQGRIRIRYRRFTTPWFNYMRIARAELGSLIERTPWHLEETLVGETGDYVAVLGKSAQVALSTAPAPEGTP